MEDLISQARQLIGYRHDNVVDLKGLIYLAMWEVSQDAGERASGVRAIAERDRHTDWALLPVAREVVANLTPSERAACGLLPLA